MLLQGGQLVGAQPSQRDAQLSYCKFKAITAPTLEATLFWQSWLVAGQARLVLSRKGLWLSGKVSVWNADGPRFNPQHLPLRRLMTR